MLGHFLAVKCRLRRTATLLDIVSVNSRTYVDRLFEEQTSSHYGKKNQVTHFK